MDKANSQLKLKKNKVRFMPYCKAHTLPVMGRAKAVMQNQMGMQ